MIGFKTFLANRPKFAANYNQLGAADQGTWQNKFQQGGAQAVKPFTQNRLAQQQAPKVANVGSYQPMRQQVSQGQQWQNRQQFQPMQPMPQTQTSGSYQMGSYAQQPQQFEQQTQPVGPMQPVGQPIQPQGWVQDPTTGQWRRG